MLYSPKLKCILRSCRLTELLLDLVFEELHFLGLSVHQQHVSGFCHADQLHDAFGVGMRTEGHVLHL